MILHPRSSSCYLFLIVMFFLCPASYLGNNFSPGYQIFVLNSLCLNDWCGFCLPTDIITLRIRVIKICESQVVHYLTIAININSNKLFYSILENNMFILTFNPQLIQTTETYFCNFYTSIMLQELENVALPFVTELNHKGETCHFRHSHIFLNFI